jgi:CRISPR-associated exonuclease Cas4
MTDAVRDAHEDSLVPISALQHFLFCPRQCALIHIERLWAEDVTTMEGRLLHEAVDASLGESRPGVRIARGLAIRSLEFGIAGRADVVEFRDGQPFPVEYKRGKPKTHRADEVQLCAQALCLEEMLACAIPEGALFYGEKRRRHPIVFDAELRALTIRVAHETRDMIARHRLPAARLTPACRKCSLEPLCRPTQFEQPPHIDTWFSSRLARALAGGA